MTPLEGSIADASGSAKSENGLEGSFLLRPNIWPIHPTVTWMHGWWKVHIPLLSFSVSTGSGRWVRGEGG